MGFGDPPPDHKLCGYLYAVVTIDGDPSSVPVNSPCRIAGDPQNVHFEADNGVVLYPIVKPSGPASGSGSVSRKRWSKFGMVHGSISVVHQLHALVMHKCVAIVARVVKIAAHGNGIGGLDRAVVLVDAYLPMAVWEGWQFPRSGPVATSFFKHVSCDWKCRSSMLESCKLEFDDSFDIWNVRDCHVLGCKQQCNAPETSKKKLFELHEIFRKLPSVTTKVERDCSGVNAADTSCKYGIWLLSDDILVTILTALSPKDLLSISLTCRHLRYLAASIMPCMKLKLYPHQQAAVEWMLKREHESAILRHPLFMDLNTEDGFNFYINTVSGEIVTGEVPIINDFRGGMFCDEPGLGKTITALSLILKTQGTLPSPPDEAQVIWCGHDVNLCGYYEVTGDSLSRGVSSMSNKTVGEKARRGQLSLDNLKPKNSNGDSTKTPISLDSGLQIPESADSCSIPGTSSEQSMRSWSSARRNLLHSYENLFPSPERKCASSGRRRASRRKRDGSPCGSSSSRKRSRVNMAENLESNETWVQCDGCGKWRKLIGGSVANTTMAWFCSMNSDPLYQSCNVPEESWDNGESITYLPGFHSKDTSGGKKENISFFTNVLKEHYPLINSVTKKALIWLAKLSPHKLSEMETTGLVYRVTLSSLLDATIPHNFEKIFQAFGLVKRAEKGATRWFYPKNLVNLAFDLDALRVALCEPLDSFRLYLSRATLIVVPSNLVDHWKTQIERHVRPGHLRVYLWGDQKKLSAHSLAWDYDVVITTFSRLSAEWSHRKRSVLMQVHWLRVMLDEGHTLGSSLNLTNKLQMAVSLRAANRWLLTGTPTPNTPNSQLSHLQPMLKFLQEEAYGQNQKSWEAGILRPFEAEMEEGRSRLLQLLHRCMISARKVDLLAIPPCIKKVTFLDFSEEHAKSYNELVETVRRNILMADWNDPSHVESLLNPKQWKFRATTIRNVRLSCCVAGHVRVTDAGQDIQETMDDLVKNGLDPKSEAYALVKYYLMYGGNCMRCKEWCRLPVITPCLHFLCLDCVALDSERCTFPGCGNLYEMESPEILTRPENPNPKWPVPKDLIELQPSYKQDDWNPDWQSTSSSKVTYLVRRLKELQEVNRKNGYIIDNGGPRDPDELNLASISCDSILSDEETCNRSTNELNKSPPEKVLIFSQFLEHIHVIEQQLTIAGVQFVGMYSPMHSSNKMKSLATFQHDANCMALLMDGSVALGLDLSFVSHVFLMEPIWDKSMEEQVISRAHRMGAKRPIHVETLAMHGTIEEQMLRFLQDAEECRKLLKEFSQDDLSGARSCRTLHDFAESNYLAKLSFVRTNSRT